MRVNSKQTQFSERRRRRKKISEGNITTIHICSKESERNETVGATCKIHRMHSPTLDSLRYRIDALSHSTRLMSATQSHYPIHRMNGERDGTQQKRTELNGAKQLRQDAHVSITETTTTTTTTKQHHQIMIADT